MRIGTIVLAALVGVGALFVLLVPDWHWPVPGRQMSLQGPSLVEFPPTGRGYTVDAPPSVPVGEPDPRPATAAFKNVRVLTDTDAQTFMRLQRAITQWVSPGQGCGFCHAGDDYASDAKPQKRVARVMLRMVRHVNASWQNHVGGAGGVTCYTCHRGQPVPSEVWFRSPARQTKPMIAKQDDWNEDADTVRGFFPTAGWDEYLLQETPGLSQSYTALPSGQVSAQVVTKRLYEYMMQMSDGIGVNCGYCHDSRAFYDWSQSTPARWVGYYGIAMTRDLNRNFLLPVAGVIPQDREQPGKTREPILPARETGPQAGNGLVLCATCHHNAPRLPGAGDPLRDFPTLRGPDSGSGLPTTLSSSR